MNKRDLLNENTFFCLAWGIAIMFFVRIYFEFIC